MNVEKCGLVVLQGVVVMGAKEDGGNVCGQAQVGWGRFHAAWRKRCAKRHRGLVLAPKKVSEQHPGGCAMSPSIESCWSVGKESRCHLDSCACDWPARRLCSPSSHEKTGKEGVMHVDK